MFTHHRIKSGPETRNTKAFGKTVIIGLGGTGQKALLRIKKNFQDNCQGKVPPCIQLLVFDTDQPDPPLRDVHGNIVQFTENEFCRLSVNVVREAIRSPYVQEWWISFPPLDNVSISDGAGGIREAGRLALFSCIDQVRNRINNAYNKMNEFGLPALMEREGFHLLESSEQVIVTGSLAGGTGGGLFFDISILCRTLGGATFKYMAYVMMPWVYHKLANTAYENTFAALVELNHLAKLSAATPLRIRYSNNLEGILEESPFHVVNLVDGQCANGDRIVKAEDLVTFVAESVYHLAGSLGAPARSVYDNIIALRNGLSDTDWDGKGRSALYSTIGVSTIRYPAPEMHRSISCERTAQLIELLLPELASSGKGDPSLLTADKSVETFVEQHQLRPAVQGIVAHLLPQQPWGTITLDDDDLQDLASSQDVIQWINQQVARERDVAAARRLDAQTRLSQELPGKLQQLLESLPPERHTAALGSFRATFNHFRETLTELSKDHDVEIEGAQQKRDLAEERIPRDNSLWYRIRGVFRSRSRAFAQGSAECLQAEATGSAIREAMDLLGSLMAFLDPLLQEIERTAGKRESLSAALRRIAHELFAEAQDYVPNKRNFRNRFEYVLGVDDRQVTETAYFWHMQDDPVPSAEELRKELDARADLRPEAAAKLGAKLDAGAYADNLYAFVAERCSAILSKSAMDVIQLNQERAKKQNQDDPTSGLIRRALDQSTLLLPLRHDRLSQAGNQVREFLIIGVGNHPGDAAKWERRFERDQAFMEQALPTYEQDWAKVTHTADPYRITLTRYKAVFPLHALKGMEALRRAYNERVLPPSHIDRRNLFVLDDPLPQDDVHHVTLKLLTLAMLKCFGVIRHVHEPQGGSYFDPAPELHPFCVNSYDVRDKLPGHPGKFYSLVEELSRPAFNTLLEAMRSELARLAATPGWLPDFFEEAQLKQKEFHARVENVASGMRKEVLLLPAVDGERRIRGLFTHEITGRYYRRQADFLRLILRNRDTLSKQVEAGKNLVEILLDRHEGYTI